MISDTMLLGVEGIEDASLPTTNRTVLPPGNIIILSAGAVATLVPDSPKQERYGAC
jgi:hypothetical protein